MSDATPHIPETTTEAQTRDNQLKIYADDDEAAMADALATARDCSTSALGRDLFRDEFRRLFGDALDATDVREGRVSDEDLRAVARGDLEADDLELGDRDDETDEDLGDRDPASYSAGATPEQLSSEGASLCYDVLREAVADPVEGGLWSESLEIDDSRVAEGTLKQNHKTASRILAGVARTNIEVGEINVVADAQIETLVERHVEHMPRSMDEESAKERLTKVYSEKTKEHFVSHPLNDAQFSRESFRDTIDTLLGDLRDAADADALDAHHIEDALRARAHALEHVELLRRDGDAMPDRFDTAFDALHAFADDVLDRLSDLEDDEQIAVLHEMEPDLRSADLFAEGSVVDHLGLRDSETEESALDISA